MAVADARAEIDAERRTIEDLAEDEQQADEQLQLLDFGGELNLTLGGPKPDTSVIKIKGIERPINGQLKRGETVTLLVTARVMETGVIDKYDDGGKQIGRGKRKSICAPISIERVSAEQADALLGTVD